MATYRISYRNGGIEEVIADWTEHVPGAVRLVRQRTSRSSVPSPEGDRGGVVVAIVPLDLIDMIERLEEPIPA
ncbi:MAG TPA: hypothetical protein VID47_13850 [Actinomycetota bacterium]|jgi:hypothetical protein